MQPQNGQKQVNMIVDFTVKNFKSIKEEQVFSMHAEKKPKHHAGNIAYIDNKIGVLKTTAIYGSNASGKTNLLIALEALKRLVVESGDWKDGDIIDVYDPYLLSKETIDAPSSFEIEFYVNKDRYSYQIQFNGKNILFEKLDLYKTAKPSNIFTRDSPDDWKSVKFGDSYKGGKRQFSFFSNNAFISKAGNSPESPDFIREVYNFFRLEIRTLVTIDTESIFLLDNIPEIKDAMNVFLRKTDFGINNFDFQKRELPEDFSLPEDISSKLRKDITTAFSKKAIFHHKSDFGELVPFEKHMESSGTNRIFQLVPIFILFLHKGGTLLVDEIESSLHPHIAELVIKIFNDPIVNIKNAQLIFTTHNTSLMSQNVLRKDQIYLSIKSSPEKGSEYMCLEDFDSSLKDSSPFAKWYNEGRLGGIPEIHYRDISDAIKKAIEHAQKEKK